MGKVIDYDNSCDALCPFTGKACVMECMLMRPTPMFGEPRCSIRVIADELVLFDKNQHAEGGDR